MPMKKQKELISVVYKEGKFYVAQCLNVDVSSFGKTKQEALMNIEEALALYFEDADEQKFSLVEQPELIHTSFKYA